MGLYVYELNLSEKRMAFRHFSSLKCLFFLRDCHRFSTIASKSVDIFLSPWLEYSLINDIFRLYVFELKTRRCKMSIPKMILAVERPKNTVVIAYGRDKNLYAVRQRVGCKYVNGRHVPVNGPTIGHIVGGRYIPLGSGGIRDVSYSSVDMKDWAGFQLAESVFADILEDLRAVYSPDDSLKIYSISMLRVCHPGVTDCELK